MLLVKTLAKKKEPSSLFVASFMVFIQVDPRRANRWVYFMQTKWLVTLDIPCKN